MGNWDLEPDILTSESVLVTIKLWNLKKKKSYEA